VVGPPVAGDGGEIKPTTAPDPVDALVRAKK
jgi:hypothetical protein